MIIALFFAAPLMALVTLGYWLWFLYFCTYSKRRKNFPRLTLIGITLTVLTLSSFYWLFGHVDMHGWPESVWDADDSVWVR